MECFEGLSNFVRDLVDVSDDYSKDSDSDTLDCTLMCENSAMNRVVHLPDNLETSSKLSLMRTKFLSRVSTVVAGTRLSNHKLTGRYARHLSSLLLLEPEDTELQHIGSTLFNGVFTNSPILRDYYTCPSKGIRIFLHWFSNMRRLIKATVKSVKLLGNMPGSPTAGRFYSTCQPLRVSYVGLRLPTAKVNRGPKSSSFVYGHMSLRELCDGFRSQTQKQAAVEVLAQCTPILDGEKRNTEVLQRAMQDDIPFLWAEMLQMTGSSKEFDDGEDPMEYREICALQESMFQAKQSSAALSAIGNLRNSILQNTGGGGGRKMSRMSVSSVMTDLSEAYGMKSIMSILKRQRQELSEDESRDLPLWVTSFLVSAHTSEHVVRLLRLMRVSRGHVLLIGPPHVGQVPMVYFAAEIAGFHVTHIDGGMVESERCEATVWKAAILDAYNSS